MEKRLKTYTEEGDPLREPHFDNFQAKFVQLTWRQRKM